MLGIQYPVFQGGMAWVADASLAAAVSNAGGLGLISSINAGTEAVRISSSVLKQIMESNLALQESRTSSPHTQSHLPGRLYSNPASIQAKAKTSTH